MVDLSETVLVSGCAAVVVGLVYSVFSLVGVEGLKLQQLHCHIRSYLKWTVTPVRLQTLELRQTLRGIRLNILGLNTAVKTRLGF